MKELERVLVINITEGISAQGTLFSVDADSVILMDQKTVLPSLKKEDMVEVMKISFKGKYDRVEILNDRQEAFQSSVQMFSPWGTTIGLYFDEEQTWVDYTKYGRTMTSRSVKLGVGTAMEKLLTSGGEDFLAKWLNIVVDDADYKRYMNFLGNYSLYPHMPIDNKYSQLSIVGLIRYVLAQVKLMGAFYVQKEALYEDSESVNRVVLSSRMISQMKSVEDIVLAVIDGLELEGIWEIYIDRNVIMPAIGVVGGSVSRSLDHLGIEKAGTIIALSHNYKSGESIGEIEIDVGLTDNQVIELKASEIVRVPMGADVSGSIELDVKQDVLVMGYGSDSRLSGGKLGLVVDVRGRPLPPLSDQVYYRKNYPHWREALQSR